MPSASYDPGNAYPLRLVTEVLVPGSRVERGPPRRRRAGTMDRPGPTTFAGWPS